MPLSDEDLQEGELEYLTEFLHGKGFDRRSPQDPYFFDIVPTRFAGEDDTDFRCCAVRILLFRADTYTEKTHIDLSKLPILIWNFPENKEQPYRFTDGGNIEIESETGINTSDLRIFMNV